MSPEQSIHRPSAFDYAKSEGLSFKAKKTFFWLWLAQLVSNLGTQTSLYGIGLWFFARTQRLTDFAVVAIVVQLARILVLPLIANRLNQWSRKKVMLMANGIGAICTISLALLLLKPGGQPNLKIILSIQGLAAMSEASLILCFSTLIPILITNKKDLVRANGLFASTDSLILTMAPFLGSWLGGEIGLRGVLTIDACSFLVAMFCVLKAPWSKKFKYNSNNEKPWQGINPIKYWHLLKHLWMKLSHAQVAIVIGTSISFAYGATEVLFPAWVAVTYGTQRMAAVLIMATLGYLTGFVIWREKVGIKWQQFWLASIFIQSVILMGAGLKIFEQSPIFWFGGVLTFSTCLPIVMSSIQQAWTQLVPAKELPKVFAIRYSFEWTARLLAFLSVSLIVDRIIKPGLSWQHLPWWIQSSLGEGSGRSIAVALGAMGWVLILAIASQSRSLFPSFTASDT